MLTSIASVVSPFHVCGTYISYVYLSIVQSIWVHVLNESLHREYIDSEASVLVYEIFNILAMRKFECPDNCTTLYSYWTRYSTACRVRYLYLEKATREINFFLLTNEFLYIFLLIFLFLLLTKGKNVIVLSYTYVDISMILFR